MQPAGLPSRENPFFDSRTFWAFVIVMGFFILWNAYLEKMYPAGEPVAESEPLSISSQRANELDGDFPQKSAEEGFVPKSGDREHEFYSPQNVEEKVEIFDFPLWTLTVSSRGMGIKDVVLKNYENRSGEQIVLADGVPFLALALGRDDSLVNFEWINVGSKSIKGRAEFRGLLFERTIEFDPDTYSLRTWVEISPLDGDTRLFDDIFLSLGDRRHTPDTGPWLAPSFDNQVWFALFDATDSRDYISDKKTTAINYPNVRLISLGAQYFTVSAIDHSTTFPRFLASTSAQDTHVWGHFQYNPPRRTDVWLLELQGFLGPKYYDLLSEVDLELSQVINYGFFAVIARPLMALLKWTYQLLGNWGLAIIALTLLVRIVLLPFNVYTYKSMKIMQKIQPEMKAIREKYKDKKTTEERMQMNQEVMALMKRHKANPIGGCLPMLLQIPVFIALYQVLGQSLELYQAPFFGWIQDLSIKDPFFVLPVGMGLAMYIQQKITPTAMDPQQAKIMMWLPPIFALLMASLPSGLTLYIFVSTVFGLIQHYFFMKDSNNQMISVKT